MKHTPDVCGGWVNALLELALTRALCLSACSVSATVLVTLSSSFSVPLFSVFEKKPIRFTLLNVAFD